MTLSRTWAITLISSFTLAAHSGWTGPSIPSPAAKEDRASVLLSQPLPKLDGTHLVTTLVEVRYGPGETSPPHSHPCPVIVYVVEGTVRSQVQGGPEVIYKPGDTFYEAPAGVHAVSGNASTSEPAKFIAMFLCDHPTPLSEDVPEKMNEKGK